MRKSQDSNKKRPEQDPYNLKKLLSSHDINILLKFRLVKLESWTLAETLLKRARDVSSKY